MDLGGAQNNQKKSPLLFLDPFIPFGVMEKGEGLPSTSQSSPQQTAIPLPEIHHIRMFMFFLDSCSCKDISTL